MNLANWLLQTARSQRDLPALFLGAGQVADYGELLERVTARAGRLAGRGVGQGDRVAIFAANEPDYLVALYAIWWIGAVVVPVNRKLHPAEVRWIAENAEAKLVLTDRPGIWDGPEATLSDEGAASAPVDREPLRLADDTLAWLFYTSGTTGKPKGVMLSHGSLVQMSLCFMTDVEALTPAHRMLYAAPASHGAGLYALPAVRAGAAHVFPVSKGFDTAEIMSLARDIGGLAFFAAPTMVKRLVTAAKACGFGGEGIEAIIYGGGPMYLADIEEALAAFPRQMKISASGAGWHESDINRWIAYPAGWKLRGELDFFDDY